MMDRQAKARYDRDRYLARRNGTHVPTGRKAGVRALGRSCYVATGGRCGHEECAAANRDYQRNKMRVRRGGLDYYLDITA